MVTVAEAKANLMRQLAELQKRKDTDEIKRGRQPGVLTSVKVVANSLYSKVFSSTEKIAMIKKGLAESARYHELFYLRDQVYQEYVDFWNANKSTLETLFASLVTIQDEEQLQKEVTRFETEVIPNDPIISELHRLQARINELSSEIEEISKARAEKRKQ